MKLKELQSKITPLPWPDCCIPRGEDNLAYACHAANHLPALVAALENLLRETTALEMFGETGNTASAANVQSATAKAIAALAAAQEVEL